MKRGGDEGMCVKEKGAHTTHKHHHHFYNINTYVTQQNTHTATTTHSTQTKHIPWQQVILHGIPNIHINTITNPIQLVQIWCNGRVSRYLRCIGG